MEKRETVSTIMSEVRANGSISTRKPSTVTMQIGHRLANDAYGLFLDEQEDKKPITGLTGFELVAIYEDGEAEPEPIKIEIEEDLEECYSSKEESMEESDKQEETFEEMLEKEEIKKGDPILDPEDDPF